MSNVHIFDESKIAWERLPDIDHVWLSILNVDDTAKVIDVLFKFSANEKIVSRKNHSCYGMGLGIMILDDVYPGLPGDVRNASASPDPNQYEILENIDIKASKISQKAEI